MNVALLAKFDSLVSGSEAHQFCSGGRYPVRSYQHEDASLEDTLAWKDSVSYKFSVSLAFKTIVGDDEEGKILSWIWKLKCVERVKMFIWIVVKGMLLTNVDRKRKGMGPDVIKTNCSRHERLWDRSIWLIWKEKNDWVFKGVMNPAADMVKKSTVLAKEAEDILVKKGVVEDSGAVIKILIDDGDSDDENGFLWGTAEFWLGIGLVRFSHVLREGNKCVDWLANLGQHGNWGTTTVLLEMPVDLIHLL
nr:LINE-type retrotransposon LIb DNA [Ipomoea batatas]